MLRDNRDFKNIKHCKSRLVRFVLIQETLNFLPLSTILIFQFRIVPTVWYFLFSILSEPVKFNELRLLFVSSFPMWFFLILFEYIYRLYGVMVNMFALGALARGLGLG